MGPLAEVAGFVGVEGQWSAVRTQVVDDDQPAILTAIAGQEAGHQETARGIILEQTSSE